VWLTASDSASWDGSPFDAESADESAAIVDVIGESVSASAGLLGKHVDVLDPTVRSTAGRVVGEDLGHPPVDRARQSGEFDGVRVGAVCKNTIIRRRA